MNLKKQIELKSKQLIKSARILPQIKIKWEKPLKLDCGNLEGLRSGKEVEYLKSKRSFPCIYFFKILGNISPKNVVERLIDYKKESDATCPKIDPKRSLNSKFLYCGSKKKDIHGRFKQHLGFSSSSTFALHLNHWTKNSGIKLEFHYALLDKEQIDFTELIESALAVKLKPLVGKMQR